MQFESLKLKTGKAYHVEGVATRDMRFTERDGKVREVKFPLSNGAILYVPVPERMATEEQMQIKASAGYVTA